MKLLPVFLTSVLALGLVACDKKGTVSGKVLDPFTEQPVPNATVWLEGTPMQIKTPDGSFHFEKVKVGEYKINAGKNKCSKTQGSVSVTEQNLDGVANVYVYSKEDMDPGLFNMSVKPSQKIQNAWLNWQAECGESQFAYRKGFADKKTKKNLDLPDYLKTPAEINTLIYQQTSVSAPIEAKSFPLVEGKIADHKDCKGFDAKETVALFPDLTKATSISSEYKSDMLYEVKGSLPKGKQALAFFQSGKLIKAYLLDAQ